MRRPAVWFSLGAIAATLAPVFGAGVAVLLHRWNLDRHTARAVD